jgi:hypothetical protein
LTKETIIRFLLPVAIALSITSCLDNFNRDLDTLYYHPSYSVPIGPLAYELPEIMPPQALTGLPDSLTLPDSIGVLIYDDSLFFINPHAGYDTVFSVPFDLQAVFEQPEYIVSLMIRSIISNGLPVGTSLQLYFTEMNGQVTDSLYADGAVSVESAAVSSDHSVVFPYYTTIDTYLDSLQIQNLTRSSGLNLYIHLQTLQPGNDTLHVYSGQKFETHLGIRAGLNVPF